MSRIFLCVSLLITTTLLAGCTGNSTDSAKHHDPIEPINRSIFAFNEVVDEYTLQPVARVYRWAVPEVGQRGINNALRNLSMPLTMTNSLLQADPENFFSAFWSFTLNSSFGFAGFYDFVGDHTNLVVRQEDFGQTLGSWGVGSGGYLVLPLLGPTTFRDAPAMVMDTIIDPMDYLNSEFVTSRAVLGVVDARAGLLDFTDDIYETSLDPYATIRSGYLQRRASQVNNSVR